MIGAVVARENGEDWECIVCDIYDTDGIHIEAKHIFSLSDYERGLRQATTPTQVEVVLHKLLRSIRSLQQATGCDGFIYFVGGAGKVKVGYSADPKRRMSKMQADSPVPLELLCAIPGNHSVERALHRFFEQTCTAGEWFMRCPFLDRLIRCIVEEQPLEAQVAKLTAALADGGGR